MAHPSRGCFFPYLQSKLQITPESFSIDAQNNLLENSKAAWRKYDSDCDFHAVIQDDAIVCDNFRDRAKAFIAEQEERRIKEGRPAQGYNFFLKQDRKKTPLWPKDGVYTDNVTRGGVAICLPVSHIPAMLAEFDRQHSRHDDDRISEYVKRAGMKIKFPVPSFIDHRSDAHSLAGNPESLSAWKYIDNGEPVSIPKIIHQLWIGPLPRPEKWMRTWKEFNPGWEYKLWTEKEIFSRLWINQSWIDYYRARRQWHGVSDICTYEILHEHGGFMIGADAVCQNPIDELFYNDFDSYSVYEDECRRPGLISPLHAAKKESVFARELIYGLMNTIPGGVPWKMVGNQYMGNMYRQTKANVHIFPSHYFNSPHFTTNKPYAGPDKIYAIQKWATTKNCYKEGIFGRMVKE